MGDLVIFHKQLGDTVLLEPVLRKLAQASGDQVQLLCPRLFEPVIELMPHTRLASGRGRWSPDRLWAYDWGGKSTNAAAITLCREKNLLIPNPEWIKWRHRLVFQHIQVQDYRNQYISAYFWDHTNVESAEQIFTPTCLEIPPDDWAVTGFDHEPYLLINPVSAWKRKSYDVSKWVRIMSHACDHLGLSRVLMTGGTADWQREHCAEIAYQASRSGLILNNLSSQTSLREFLHLISHSRMIICVDGASAHLARGFGVPCVTIFGPSYRWMWHLEDEFNLALDASDYSTKPRPETTLVPTEAVTAAITRLSKHIPKREILHQSL